MLLFLSRKEDVLTLNSFFCRLLISSGRESVILFVAHDNGAANRTYEKIGFAGLDGSPVEGVSSWMEIGFDREMVELGHW